MGDDLCKNKRRVKSSRRLTYSCHLHRKYRLTPLPPPFLTFNTASTTLDKIYKNHTSQTFATADNGGPSKIALPSQPSPSPSSSPSPLNPNLPPNPTHLCLLASHPFTPSPICMAH